LATSRRRTPEQRRPNYRRLSRHDVIGLIWLRHGRPVVALTADRAVTAGGPKANKNNFRHGRYSAEAIAQRRKIRELVRAMRALAREDQV
jgi:hypothetical protein